MLVFHLSVYLFAVIGVLLSIRKCIEMSKGTDRIKRLIHWYKEGNVPEKIRKFYMGSTLWVCLGGFIYLLCKDWAHDYSTVNSWTAFLNAILSGANGRVFLIIALYFGMSVVLLILRFPLQKYEQVKMFGVEYKMQVEKIADTAQKEMENLEFYDKINFSSLWEMNSEDHLYDAILPYLKVNSQGEIEFIDQIEAIRKGIACWVTILGLNTPAFIVTQHQVVEVKTGILDDEDLKLMSYDLTIVAQRANRKKQFEMYQSKGISYIAVPITQGFSDPEKLHAMVCLQSENIMFTENDSVLINTIISIVYNLGALAKDDLIAQQQDQSQGAGAQSGQAGRNNP